MKVQWYRSATVGIFSNAGTSILCDPWITDGAFIGSWYHWPPLEGFEFDYLSNKKWDAVYISHFHADHFDRKLLASIVRRQPGIRVLIPTYSNKWLKRAVLNCGLTANSVIEMPNNESVNFKDFKITMYVADYCNPTICGSSISCMSTPRKRTSNDSVALIESDDQTILNANDALAVHSAHRLWPLIGKVSLLLGHYGGAGPYPQCFTDIDAENKMIEAKKTGLVFVNRLIQTAEKLKAQFTMPFAGQYVLGGSLVGLNKFRSVIPLDEVINRISDSGTTKPISLMPFGEFDLNNENLTQEWQEPSLDVYKSYLEQIKVKLFPYQKIQEEWPDSKSSLIRALQKVKTEFDFFIDEGGVGSDSSITVKTVAEEITLNFGKESSNISETPIFDNRTVINIDQRLLKRLITRRPNYSGFTQYHFNQAEIGSHLNWARTGRYPPETQFLNFMQDNLI
jgi:UDP-MurNAc hydroxylase